MSFDAKSIQSALQKAKRPELARILSEAWEIPITEYSTTLWETQYSQHIRRMPIIMLTGYTEYRRVTEARDMG